MGLTQVAPKRLTFRSEIRPSPVRSSHQAADAIGQAQIGGTSCDALHGRNDIAIVHGWTFVPMPGKLALFCWIEWI